MARLWSLLAILPAIRLSTAQLFTVNCAPLTIQRGDPIASPGQISPHVHVVVGGTAFQLTQSNDQAVLANATTCDKVLDNSNYWQPQLYHQRRDGRFELVRMQGIVSRPFLYDGDRNKEAATDRGQAAYYIDRACDYRPARQNCDGTPTAKAPPAGLRMVVGTPSRRSAATRYDLAFWR